MNLKSLIILTLPIFVNARLKINITVSTDRINMYARTFGTDVKLVTEKEMETFNFTVSNINRGFRVELGKVPDNFFLKDPTPYEDLFNKFEWEQVKRVISISDVKILDTITEDAVLKVRRYTNNSPDVIRSNLSIFKNVENTIRPMWSEQGLPHNDIYYDLAIILNDKYIDYSSNKWRDDRYKSRTSVVGISQEGYIQIKPGKTITVTLLAKKSIALVEIQYRAFLTGSIIGDYENLYGKYHFYAPSVKSIMRAAKLNNNIFTTELLEIRCFTSPELKLSDEDGRKVDIIRPTFPLRYKKKKVVPVK